MSWEGVVRLGASELASALGYNPHRSPWYFLRRETFSKNGDPEGPSTATKPSATLPTGWYEATQIEARRLASEFPVEDPSFAAALSEARRSREEGQEPRQALERLQAMLDRCALANEQIKSAVLACAKKEISCAWGKRLEKATAEAYAANFLSPEERLNLAGDAFGKPLPLCRTVLSANFEFADSRDGRGGLVSLELRGQPDGALVGSDLVFEFKSRTLPPKGCLWPVQPPTYDVVQCVAYSWLWNGNAKGRVVLVERRPAMGGSIAPECPTGFDLVCSEPATPELEASVARRCVSFLKLVALCKRSPGFFGSLERLSPADRDEQIKNFLSGGEDPRP